MELAQAHTHTRVLMGDTTHLTVKLIKIMSLGYRKLEKRLENPIG